MVESGKEGEVNCPSCSRRKSGQIPALTSATQMGKSGQIPVLTSATQMGWVLSSRNPFFAHTIAQSRLGIRFRIKKELHVFKRPNGRRCFFKGQETERILFGGGKGSLGRNLVVRCSWLVGGGLCATER